jgi:two-component system CheB/CheR fusion protein
MASKSGSGGRGRSSKRKKDFLVVGIGASAGGVKALEQFLTRMPDESGMAFVIILHLSPEYESNLAALLQRKTKMPVIQITETVKVEPNRVYVIPPAKHLIMVDGVIKLADADRRIGKRVPIDLFFRTLAEAYAHLSIGVVLSGTGSDGTLGLRRIKEQGGISIAQDLEEAEYDGMPQSAIEAGLVDFVLPIAEMPQKLIAIRETSERIQIPPEGDKPPRGAEADALREVLALLRARTGHDFHNYKRSTILRRVARRLQVTNLDEISDYLQFLRKNPMEVQGLLSELLINVTNFFRDHNAFEAIEQYAIPNLFANKTDGEPVRVWVAGCATGEEAYSLAILLSEHASKNDQLPNIQIFATDIDDETILEAREGLYPETIMVDVSSERLKRFFTKEGSHYRVKKEIREMELFAPHNILRDPPFSKLDMVSCRNLLIYLNRETQDRVLELFHFSLKPNGVLFLGTSESADSLPELYVPVDKKSRIFKRSTLSSIKPPVPSMPLAGRWGAKAPDVTLPAQKDFTYAELHHELLESYSPASVLINQDHDIVHLSEKAGAYLRFVGGEPSRSLLRVVHPDLRLDLRTTLFAAVQEGAENESRRVPVKIEGHTRFINIIVRPVKKAVAEKGFLLVLFVEETPSRSSEENEAKLSESTEPNNIEPVVRQLEDELQRTKDQLRATIEQYETSNEELKASNEELQAINEELRSATEELETSKEELQSLNEELQTVNHELKDKVDEITRVNSDLQNLLAATDIGTIFLDRDLRIKRYTPQAQEFFNIIPTDVGRPLAHVTHKLAYTGFSDDAKRVLASLVRAEHEVQSSEGRWYIARLLPYRTLEDKIDGVVLTFIDITERRRAEGRLSSSEERLRVTLDSIEDYAILTTNLNGQIESWNRGAERIFGYREQEIIGQPVSLIFTPEERERGVDKMERATAYEEGRAEDERWHFRKDGSRFFASGVLTTLRDGDIIGYVKILRDLTESKHAEEVRTKLTAQLDKEREVLEDRVKERTSELKTSNELLEAEVVGHRTAEEQVKELLRRVVNTQELERKRISRELHDELGQQLTALNLAVELIQKRQTAETQLSGELKRLQSMIHQLDKDLTFLAWELRSTLIDEIGFVAALENYINEWTERFSVPAKFHTADLGSQRLLREIETNLYRVVQEALNNVFKHSEANQVDVILEYRNGDVVLIIEDDGKGFDIEQLMNSENKGMGIISMRERAALTGGTIEVESAPNKGTTIYVRTPTQFEGNNKDE